MRFEHEVFQGPRAVDVSTESKVDPYSKKRIDAWRVHSEVDDPGLVASRRRFVNSPDSEILAGGINMKGDRGVPLVREGNMFLWGFVGSPGIMTEPGKALFVNAVSYISKFDGHGPTRRAGVMARDQWHGILDSPYIEGAQKLARYFSAELVASHGDNKDAYRKALESGDAYLFVPVGSKMLHVDGDAQKFGHATNSLALIRAAMEDGTPAGSRVLARYWPDDDLVPARPKSAADLDAMAEDLFFSEPYGYRWLSVPPSAGPEAWEVEDVVRAMDMPAPTSFEPVALGAGVVASYNSEKGAFDSCMGLVTVVVEGVILEGWHVTIDAGGSPMPTLGLTLDLPEGCRLVGATRVAADSTHTAQATGAVEASGRFRMSQDVWLTCAAGAHELNGTVEFQACDAERCLPPRSFEFTQKVQVR